MAKNHPKVIKKELVKIFEKNEETEVVKSLKKSVDG